jgi:hypothetical protein
MKCVLKILLTQDRVQILKIGDDSLDYFCRNVGQESIKKEIDKVFSHSGLYFDKGLWLVNTENLKTVTLRSWESIKPRLNQLIQTEMRNRLISNIIK